MRYAILVVGLVVLGMLVMEFNGRTTELNQLIAENEKVKAQLQERTGTQAALEAQIAFATSEPAVVKWAHEDGHMVRDGEISVVPVSSDQIAPEPTPAPVVTPQEMNNLESWWFLLVGPLSP
jgi:cell division protein FtsB